MFKTDIITVQTRVNKVKGKQTSPFSMWQPYDSNHTNENDRNYIALSINICAWNTNKEKYTYKTLTWFIDESNTYVALSVLTVFHSNINITTQTEKYLKALNYTTQTEK